VCGDVVTSDEVTVSALEPDILEDGVYRLTLHCHPFIVGIGQIVAELIKAFAPIAGLEFISAYIQNKPEGDEKVDYNHKDIIIRFRVKTESPPVEWVAVIKAVLTVLAIFGIVLIVWELAKEEVLKPAIFLGILVFAFLILREVRR